MKEFMILINILYFLNLIFQNQTVTCSHFYILAIKKQILNLIIQLYGSCLQHFYVPNTLPFLLENVPINVNSTNSYTFHSILRVLLIIMYLSNRYIYLIK